MCIQTCLDMSDKYGASQPDAFLHKGMRGFMAKDSGKMQQPHGQRYHSGTGVVAVGFISKPTGFIISESCGIGG